MIVEETQEELMERIKKMSPEELLEFQKSRCIFCHIVSGKVPAKKIYEDDKVIAILDINPATQGHVLLMPKEHYAIMPQIPKDVLEHLSVVSKRLSQTALQALGAKGTNILIQNGPAAGQKAQHFMIHIIPRFEANEIKIGLKEQDISESNYKTIKDRLQSRVSSLLGVTEVHKKEQEIIEHGNKLVADIDEENDDLPSTEQIPQKSVQEQFQKPHHEMSSAKQPTQSSTKQSQHITEQPKHNPQQSQSNLQQPQSNTEQFQPINEQPKHNPQQPQSNTEQFQPITEQPKHNPQQSQSNIEQFQPITEQPKHNLRPPQFNSQTNQANEVNTQPTNNISIPKSALLDMSSVNSFISSTNKEIDELKSVIDPELEANDLIDQETNNEFNNSSENKFENETTNEDSIIKEDDSKKNKKRMKSEINLDDISKILGI